jgi:fucose 4-O-acetylase-like acetyltransferase
MQRLADIERAKGLAVVLVVFGHLVARQDPLVVAWYEPARVLVYLFHMPFFMYLSGYVTGLGKQPASLAVWSALVRRRAVRLLLPFAAFGLLVMFAKLALAGLVHVDNVPDGVSAGLRGLLWDTSRSPALSVWYLAVLFAYAAALPVLLRISHGRVAPVAMLALLLFATPMPDTAYLDRIGTYFVFFVVGVAAARSGAAWRHRLDRWSGISLAAFGLALLAFRCGLLGDPGSLGWPGWPYKAYLLAFGLLSIPALHGLVRSTLLSGSTVLFLLGRDCFAIYLLNTLMIGAAKAVTLSAMPWDGPRFLPVSVLLMAAGLFGPVAAMAVLRPRLGPLVRAAA